MSLPFASTAKGGAGEALAKNMGLTHTSQNSAGKCLLKLKLET